MNAIRWEIDINGEKTIADEIITDKPQHVLVRGQGIPPAASYVGKIKAYIYEGDAETVRTLLYTDLDDVTITALLPNVMQKRKDARLGFVKYLKNLPDVTVLDEKQRCLVSVFIHDIKYASFTYSCLGAMSDEDREHFYSRVRELLRNRFTF